MGSETRGLALSYDELTMSVQAGWLNKERQNVIVLGRRIGEKRTLNKKRVGTYGEGLLFFAN